MLNSIVIMGRLVADPELRSTTSGIAVSSIRVAVDRDFADKQSGDRQADFFDVVVWRSTAEFVSRYFKKGSMIIVQGSMQSRRWQDKDGNNRISWEIQANNVYFGESKRSGGASGYDDDPNRFDSYTPPPERRNDAAAAQEIAEPTSSYSSGTANDFTPLPDDDLPF